MAKKKAGLDQFTPGVAGTTATTNYQQVLAEYDDNSQLVSFIAPDGTRYFINGQAGVNSLIAGANVTLTPPSGQGNVRVDVTEVGTVQSVALSMPNAFTVKNSPIINSGTLLVEYGAGQIPPANLGTGSTGSPQLFLNSAGQFTPIVGTATPFLRFNGSVLGGFNQTFSAQILSTYGNDATLITVVVNGVIITPPTISPASAGSYRLTDTVLTITDYLQPNAIVEVISKVLIASTNTVGTVNSVGLSVPQGLRVGNSPITVAGTLALNWDTGSSFIPQNSLGAGTTGAQTVLTGGSSNAAWAPYSGLIADTNGVQTLNNKTLNSPVISNLATPRLAGDPATKGYVDGLTTGFAVKENADFATTVDLPGVWTPTDLTLTGPINQALVIDGYTFTNADLLARILVKNQGQTSVFSANIVNAGSGYQVGNVLVVQGGAPVGNVEANRGRFIVASAGEGGTLGSLTLDNGGDYETLPPDPTSLLDTGLPTQLIVNIANGSTANSVTTYAIIVGSISTFTNITLTNVPANTSSAQIGNLLVQNTPAGWSGVASTVGSNTQVTFVSNSSEPLITGTVTVTYSGDALPAVNPATPSLISARNGQLATGTGATVNLNYSDLTFENGIYTLDAVQTASSGVSLIRSGDMNTWDEVYRSLVNVSRGDTNGGSTWIANVPQTGTIGVTGVNFVQFGGTGVITGVPRGGTGTNNLPVGNLLIGNGTAPVLTNGNLFWDNVNSRLGIGTSTPIAGIDVRKGIRLQQGYEAFNLITTSLVGPQTFDISTGALFLYTGAATGNFQFNFTATNGNINTRLPVGHSLTVTVITNQGATAYYLNQPVQIDGTTTGVTASWQGAIAPSFGNPNSQDVYTFTIIKTASLTYAVLGVRTQYGV